MWGTFPISGIVCIRVGGYRGRRDFYFGFAQFLFRCTFLLKKEGHEIFPQRFDV
jgi:hypothetical protein